MNWIVTVGDLWLKLLGGLAGGAVVFGVLSRLMPCNPGMYWWKDLRAVGTDFLYWFIVPVFLRLARTLMLVAGVLLLFGGQEPVFLPVKHLPLWLQCVLVLLLQDVLLYGIHRVFHSRLAWKFHAIHHSPKVLDWMSTLRFHPLNNLLAFHLSDIAVLLLGFSPETLVILAPVNLAYSAMVHANLNWTFGPLRYVFASPVFHRWHHTTQEEGLDKNFASTFPFLDLIFGTFHMPPGKLPEHFGTGEPDFPEGFVQQFLHPFRQAPNLTRGARLRRAAVMAASGMAVVALVGGVLHVMARLGNEEEQVARALQQADAARHVIQLDRARRAWAENDLVQATAALDAVSGPGEETPDVGQMRDLCRRKCLVLAGHAAPVTAMALSSDGHRLVSGGEDGTVKVWDARTGQEALTLKRHTGPVTAVVLSPDGQWFASASYDRTVRVWDAQTGQEKSLLAGHSGAVLSLAVSGDGRRLVTGSVDLTAKVWDVAKGRALLTLTGHVGAVSGVALSGDGRRVVSASASTAKVWDATTGREELTLEGHTDLVYAVAISPDGKHIISGSFDRSVKVWDAETGQERLTLTGHTDAVYSLALSPDGKHLVSGSKDKTVKVWDALLGRETLTLKGHTDAVTGVALSGDGQRIFSSSRDGTLKVWNAQQCLPEKVAAD